MRYIIGILVFLLTIILVITMLGGHVLDYLNLPTIVMFVLTYAAVIVMKGGFKTFVIAVNALLSKNYSISAADKEKAIRLFRLLAKSTIYAAILYTMICLFNMLIGVDWHYEGAELKRALAGNTAAGFLPMFYGLIANLVFINPAIDMLESRHNVDVKTVISEKQVMDKLLELCYKQGVSPEEILDASEISFRKKQ